MCWLASWSQLGTQWALVVSRTRTLCPARAAISAGGAAEASRSDSAAWRRSKGGAPAGRFAWPGMATVRI